MKKNSMFKDNYREILKAAKLLSGLTYKAIGAKIERQYRGGCYSEGSISEIFCGKANTPYLIRKIAELLNADVIKPEFIELMGRDIKIKKRSGRDYQE